MVPATRRQHRWLGIVLLLPFVVWAGTGIFFLVRPGFAEAYEPLPVRQYGLSTAAGLPTEIQPDWQELRYFHSVLGEHLIVRRGGEWQHLNALTGDTWPLPGTSELTLLLEDAFNANPDRYGSIVAIQGNSATTDTGVRLLVNWDTLSISQNGRDTRWIDRIYSMHYLEWTGFYWTDRILGVGGLLALIYMTMTGARLAFRRQPENDRMVS